MVVSFGDGEAERRYQVQIDGSEVTCHDEIVAVKSKKHGTCASADSANDAVQVDETVRVPKVLINGLEFKGIDLGIDTNPSWRWRRQLIKPSWLGEAFYFFLIKLPVLSY